MTTLSMLTLALSEPCKPSTRTGQDSCTDTESQLQLTHFAKDIHLLSTSQHGTTHIQKLSFVYSRTWYKRKDYPTHQDKVRTLTRN